MDVECASVYTEGRLLYSAVRRHCLKAILMTVSLGMILSIIVICNPSRGLRSSMTLEGRSLSQGACNSTTVLVLVAHDRPEYFRQTLSSLSQARRLAEVCVLLSVDNGAFVEPANALMSEFLPNVSSIGTVYHAPPMLSLVWTWDDPITWHHQQIFNAIFVDRNFEFGIILETDLIVSPDFIEYMLAGRSYLANKAASQLFCVSGWNDNGFDHLTLREDRLFRTEFFPGLGWILSRDSWTDFLSDNWPTHGGYDWWVRDQIKEKKLDCIAPEVSRTHHVSKYGVHVNGAGHFIYDRMVLSSGTQLVEPSEWELVANPETFEQRLYEETILRNRKIFFTNENVTEFSKALSTSRNDYLVAVVNKGHIASLLSKLRLYPDVIRSGYRGLLSVRFKDTNNQVTLIEDNAQQQFIQDILHKPT